MRSLQAERDGIMIRCCSPAQLVLIACRDIARVRQVYRMQARRDQRGARLLGTDAAVLAKGSRQSARRRAWSASATRADLVHDCDAPAQMRLSSTGQALEQGHAVERDAARHEARHGQTIAHERMGQCALTRSDSPTMPSTSSRSSVNETLRTGRTVPSGDA